MPVLRRPKLPPRPPAYAPASSLPLRRRGAKSSAGGRIQRQFVRWVSERALVQRVPPGPGRSSSKFSTGWAGSSDEYAMVAQAAMSISSAARGAAVASPAKGRLRSCERSVIPLSNGKSPIQVHLTHRSREMDSNLWFLVSTTAKIVSHVASRVISAVRRGWLAFAPNGREPRLPMPRQSRGAVVMAHLHEAGQGDVIAPSVEIEEAGIAVVAQALLVIPSRI